MGVQPEGEEIRKAVKWISEARQADPKVNLDKLVETACMTFDLSPKEAVFLTKLVRGEMGK